MPAAVQLLLVRVYAMSNYVLKYGRDERVKYISHLDFIRMFHRSVRRAGLPFSFSQGFNPHPIMTVAMPLSVGVTAEGEYMKVGFEKEITDEDIRILNENLPHGFYISDWSKQGEGVDISKLDRADYEVQVEVLSGADIDVSKIMDFSELTVMKKSKSGVKPSNIRPYIYSLEVADKGDNFILLKMCLACSNTYNLKPESVILAMEEKLSGFKSSFISVHRKRLFGVK